MFLNHIKDLTVGTRRLPANQQHQPGRTKLDITFGSPGYFCGMHSEWLFRAFPACPKPNKIPSITMSVERCCLGLDWFGEGEDFAYLLSALQRKARGISNGFSSLCTMKIKIPSAFETRVCLGLCIVTKHKLYPVQKMITKEKISSSSLFSQGYWE